MTQEKLIQDYMRVVVSKKSASTKEAYRLDVSRFLDYLADVECGIDEITENTLHGYTDSMEKAGKSIPYQKRALAAVNSFVSFLGTEGITRDVPYVRKLVSGAAPRDFTFLSDEQVESFLSGFEVSEYTQRNRVMALLLVKMGLKVTQLISLKVSDFNTKKKTLHVKKKDLPVPEDVYSHLVSYVQNIRESSRSDYMFVSQKTRVSGDSISRKSVWRTLESNGKWVKLPVKVTPSVLRNTFIRNKIVSGVEREELVKLLQSMTLDSVETYYQAYG